MRYQTYVLHLIDGTAIPMVEDYDLPAEKGIVGTSPKINREIRNYTESMFFGLSMRQFIFSVLACSVAVGLYFILRPYFGVETLSWMCILGAAPFAMLGFITYHGMTAEQFIWAWLRSEMLEPKEFKFEDSNYYYAALKDTIEELQTGRPGKKRRKEPKHFSKRKEAKHD